MAYVTLEALKQHLRVEYTADDSYLTTLIDVAEAAIGNELGKPLANFAADGTLPAPLVHAIKLLCGDLYNNRESVAFATPHEVPRSLEYLLQPYKVYNVLCVPSLDVTDILEVVDSENEIENEEQNDEVGTTE